MLDNAMRQKLRMMLKLLDLKDEYDSNPQMCADDRRRHMLAAIRAEVDDESRERIDMLEKMMDMAELMQFFGTSDTGRENGE